MTKEKEQYQDKLREALADGKLTDLERSSLDFFQHKLGLSDEDAFIIFEDVLDELKGKPARAGSKHQARPEQQAETMEPVADDDTADEFGTRKKRIKYVSWEEFEKEQPAKDELKKRWMPIAKRAHEFIENILRDNNLEYEIRYGDGTFSFSVPKQKAKSRQRRFVRFGLVSFNRKHSYLDGLYVNDVKDIPPDAVCDKPEEDLPSYSYWFVALDDFNRVEDQITAGLVRSYRILAK